MIKVKVPFEDLRESSDTDDWDDEGSRGDVGAQLYRMRRHIGDMNMAYRDRLDEMEARFSAGLNELRSDFTAKLDQVLALLEEKRTPQPISSMEHRYCILGGSRHG